MTPPLLIAGDHLFEWIHSYHTFPACVVLFTVNPLTHSPTPEVSVDRHTIYGCPIYTVTFWDIPRYIPPILHTSLQTIEDALEADLESFVTCLEVFIQEHFKPYPPFVKEGYTNLLPHPPCLTPRSITIPTLFLWDIVRSEFRHTPDTSIRLGSKRKWGKSAGAGGPRPTGVCQTVGK